MNISIVYWVAGILGLIVFVISFIATIRIISIWHLLNEIVLSGAIPKVLEERAKRNAREMLKMGYIENDKRATEISQILSKLTNDKEAIQLAHKLDELKRQQGRGE